MIEIVSAVLKVFLLPIFSFLISIWLALISIMQESRRSHLKKTSPGSAEGQMLKSENHKLATWQWLEIWTSSVQRRQLCLLLFLLLTDPGRKWDLCDWPASTLTEDGLNLFGSDEFSFLFSSELKDQFCISWTPSSAHPQTPGDVGLTWSCSTPEAVDQWAEC